MDNEHAMPITEDPIYGMSRAWLGDALNTARRINRELQAKAEGLEVRVNELEGKLAQAEEEKHAHARKLVSRARADWAKEGEAAMTRRDKLVAAEALETFAARLSNQRIDLAGSYLMRKEADRLRHEAEGGAA